MTTRSDFIAPKQPKNRTIHTRPVTLRAALAIDCTDLASNLKHLVHVMALHADNTTGEGLYSQISIGSLMTCSDRNVRKLQDALDDAWERGESPVHITYERRYNKSSRYTITVKDDAVLNLRDRPAKESSGTRVPVNLPESTGTLVPDNAESTGTPVPHTPDLQIRSTPGQPEPQGLLS